MYLGGLPSLGNAFGGYRTLGEKNLTLKGAEKGMLTRSNFPLTQILCFELSHRTRKLNTGGGDGFLEINQMERIGTFAGSAGE